MEVTFMDKTQYSRKTRFDLDRKVVFGLSIFILIFFIYMFVAATGFMSSARTYPFFTSLTGVIVTGIAIIRVWRGKEPVKDMDESKIFQDTEPSINFYRKAGIYIGSFVLYYFGIWILGFLAATGIYIFLFIYYKSRSIRFSIFLTLAGLALTLFLSWLLELFLPQGLWRLLIT